MSFTIETVCGHCNRPLVIEIDSELNYRVLDEEADPMIYVPMVDFETLEDPSIIDAF
ncbi:MAG: hypothetical protein P8Y98_09840 [Anaerolineales bacterium]